MMLTSKANILLNRQSNKGNINQNNNLRYYNNRHHNYGTYYSSTNQNKNQVTNNQNQYSTRPIPVNQRGNDHTFSMDLNQGRQNNPLIS